MNTSELYALWLSRADTEYKTELQSITDEREIEDRFYRTLEFGTAGLRGILGAGTNRMNTHVVRQATSALAEYIKSIEGAAGKGVVIAYDSRRKSREFALCSALVLSKAGIKTYLFSELHPVPMLSFAVRHLHTAAGIVITASHNPPEYNGYKVYWQDSGQITPDRSKPISEIIDRTDPFSVESMTEDKAIKTGFLRYIGSEVYEAYFVYTETLSQNALTQAQKDALTIVYTPLHGSGYKPVTTLLSRMGFNNVHIVDEQREPDGDFPTVKAPNPENVECFTLAKKLGEKADADILLATDPDSDRLGAMIRTNGGYTALTGNKIGSLLIYYVLSSKKAQGKLPSDAYVVRSIVSTPLADAICESFGVEIRTVLTGFRYIAEQIEQGNGSFIFGFEESYGFLAGTSVRDKDAVLASMLICEAAAYYKAQGKTLSDVLGEIERKYGAYEEKSISFSVSGKDGMEKLAVFMKKQHDAPAAEIAGRRVLAVADYEKGTYTSEGENHPINLPKSNVIAYESEGGVKITYRPSGTEPKLKVYIAVKAENADRAREICRETEAALGSIIDN